jgi:predicted component of type VI protein secretion system
MARVMRAVLLCCAVLGLLAACGGSSEKQWYKPNAEYTVAEFQRDRTACEKNGQIDEECLRQRGWVSLTPDKEKPLPPIPTTKQKYY